MPLIALSGVTVRFGDRTLLKDVSFGIEPGERWGLVGRNGSGKTTLVNVILGAQPVASGSVVLTPRMKINVMDQHRVFGDAGSVWEAASGAFADLLALERSLEAQGQAIAAAGEKVTEAMLDRYGRDLERFQQEDGYSVAARVDAVLAGLGFDPEAARTTELRTLSGGERGRLALARQLAAPADLLLLDEPTNHLDLDTTRWLEEYLRSLPCAVLLISHDRALLDNVCDHMLHIEGNTTFAYEGGYSRFVALRDERRQAEQRAFEKQSTAIAKQDEYIRRNLAGRHAQQAVGRRKLLNRLPRLAPPPGSEPVMAPRFEPRERGGEQVLVIEEVRTRYGERVLLERFSAMVRRGEFIGLIGPNGAGKSTLLNVLTGGRLADDGRVKVGDSIVAGYYRQDLGHVPQDRTLFDIIYDARPRWSRGQVQGHLGKYGFSGDSVLRKAASLSGGERARVALALLELEGANLLIFDEPTNHLDVEAIEALEEAIEQFDGTVVLVSHDRALLRALARRVWVLHDRHITDYPGSFGEWEQASAELAHAARVKAAEEEKLRLMHEKQKLKRREETKGDEKAKKREQEQRLRKAEEEVARHEQRIQQIQAELGDADLYAKPDGVKRSIALGKELEDVKKKLDVAYQQWEQLTG